jgi:hypothetical protein
MDCPSMTTCAKMMEYCSVDLGIYAHVVALTA